MATQRGSEIGRLRLQNQSIAQPTIQTPEEVVRRLGAVQAQDYLGALWAIGLRMRTATEALVEQALAARTIVRTWPMRGTLHFVAAPDVRWMLSLMAPRVVKGAAARYRQLELDDAVFTRSEKILVRALEGSRQLSRPAIYELLNAEGIATAASRGLHILGRLAHEQVLVFGTREGKQHTFTLLDEWVPATPKLSREESLAELATRYFTSHGPATAHDLSWWSGLPLYDVRAGIAHAGSRLVEETFEGTTYWLGEGTRALDESSRGTFLLPSFDEFTVAYRNRDAIVDPAFANRINYGGGMLSPVIVIDGRVQGTWSRKLKKGRATAGAARSASVLVSTQPFGRFTRGQQQAIAAATEGYGRFLGGPGGPLLVT